MKDEDVKVEDYFDGMAGEGLENFTAETVTTAYLSMVQPGSSAEVGHQAGTWRNTATDEGLGYIIEVVVLAFKTVWVERSKDPPYGTVGIYAPNGIEVNIERPKPGTRGFPKMTNPLTGNQVQELFIYAIVLKELPEAGVLYFSPTVGSMRTCKQWNAKLRSQRLPSGRLAPLHAFSWLLETGLVQNPAKPNNPKEQICKFTKVTIGSLLLKDWHITYVTPQLEIAKNVQLLAAPEKSGDTEVLE
jgi:hypothetical protein